MTEFETYDDYPPENETPNWDEYTVEIDGSELPTWQIDVIDERLCFSIATDQIDGSGCHVRTVPTGSAVPIKTPVEEFTGSVAYINIEHGDLLVCIDRVGDDES